jgi:hypothetical protein
MLKKTQENDKIKDSWCINNKIPLLRVDNIIDIPKNIDKFIKYIEGRETGITEIFDRRKRVTNS